MLKPDACVKRYFPLISILLVLYFVCCYVVFALLRPYPGGADPSFYFHVAKNIAHGRGLVADIIWHWGYFPPDVTSYAAAYWKPLGPILMAIPIYLFGDHLAAALIVPIAFALAAAVVAMMICRSFLDDLGIDRNQASRISIFAFALTALHPFLVDVALSTNPTTIFIFFAALSMHLVSCPRWASIFTAGLCAGMAYLARNDGLLLIAALTLGLLWTYGLTKKFITSLLIFVIASMPFVMFERISAMRAGVPMGMELALISYRSLDGIYALPGQISPGDIFSMPLKDILQPRLYALARNTAVLLEDINLLFWGFAGIALFSFRKYFLKRSEGFARLIPWISFLAVDFFVNCLVFSATGTSSFPATVRVFIPLLAALGAIVLLHLHRHEREPMQPIAKVVVFIFVAYLGVTAFYDVRVSWALRRGEAADLRSLAQIVGGIRHQYLADADSLIVMSRQCYDTPDYFAAKGVCTPRGDVSAVLTVARRYGVQILILERKYFPDLKAFTDDEKFQAQFKFIDEVDSKRIYVMAH